MFLTLCRRELADHLMSLRFALTLVITVLLMAANGILFCGADYPARQERYQEEVARARSWLEGHLATLGDLAERGPGLVAKRPSPLTFVAGGREEYLPPQVRAESTSSYGSSWGFDLRMPWHLRYDPPQAPPDAGVVPDFVDLDWAFIVGFCLSLMTLLLTYDSVCGERQEGTLRLLLSGPVPRSLVLAGKFAAVWTVLAVALAAGAALNLLILGLFGPVELGAAVAARLALALAASLLYLACFVGLGLLVSTRSRRPAASLVSLLLIWTVLLVLLPNTTSGLVTCFSPPSADQKAHGDQQEALWEESGIRRLASPVPEGQRPPYEYVKRFSDFLAARLRLDEEFAEQGLRRQLAPVELGRNLNRLSPFGTYQFALESLAGTGLPRHRRFLDQARRYVRDFRGFLDERDQADGGSYHLFGLAAGLSARPVPPETVPVFAEDLAVGPALQDAAFDLLLLGLMAVAAFLAAHAAFLRSEVA